VRLSSANAAFVSLAVVEEWNEFQGINYALIMRTRRLKSALPKTFCNINDDATYSAILVCHTTKHPHLGPKPLAGGLGCRDGATMPTLANRIEYGNNEYGNCIRIQRRRLMKDAHHVASSNLAVLPLTD